MRISKVTLLFLFFISFNSYAIDIEEVTTKKGFKFLFVENNDIPKVSMQITFKDAGYAYESKEKQGLSWFVSSIIQEGAGKNDAQKFAKELEDKGIRLSFSTGLENFTISLDTLSENLESGISLLSDAIMRPRADENGFNRILEIAKVQLNMLQTIPEFVAAEELDKLMFKKHPYSKSEYGNLETITSITREDILTYMRHNFTKSNIVISIAGSVKKEGAAQLLDKYLSKLPSKRSKIRKIPVKDKFSPSETKRIFMDIPQSVIFFAQKGIAYRDPNYYNAVVLVNALGGVGLNSLLMREIRENLGITYGVRANIVNHKYGNIIAGSLNTDNTTADKAILAVKEVFNRVQQEGINEQLFKDTKISVANSYTFSMFNNNDIVAELNHIQVEDVDINDMDDFVNLIDSIKLEEVNELAKSLLEPKNLFFVEVGKNA
ncbi:MAG: pitrilysin family protein [Wolbachia endosymbiont of Tyrophagus putrescentiae]|nr:pitrilysin family protein [Wolbachia endosymbiont of Tyrophagus putrescentiae]